MTVAVMVEHGAQVFLDRGPAAALPILNRARQLAAAGTPAAIAAGHVWGFTAYATGDPQGLLEAEAAANASELAGGRNPEGAQWWNAPLAYATLLKGSSRFPAMMRVFEAALAGGTLRTDPMMVFQSLFQWVEALWLAGRLAEALTWSDRMIEAAELVPFARRWAAADKALVLMDLGRAEDAATWCQGLGEPGDDGLYVRFVALFSCGRLALRQRDPQAACCIFARMQDLAGSLGIADPCLVPWAGDAITSYLACGQDDRARQIAEWTGQWAQDHLAEWPGVVAATGRALLAERQSELQAAQQHFEQALALHAGLGMPVARAQTLTDYGAFLNRTGRPARARPLLAEALAVTQRCGAGWHYGQALIQYRRAGGRSGTTAPGTLTPQEAAVARLARDGKTNQEIAQQLYLSVNTVQTHLRHAYRKLGIQRRGQLINTPHLG